MKRCFKWLVNWFTQWARKMTWQEKVGFILGALLSIIIGIILFLSIDKEPATSEDYLFLEQQAINVQRNPELLLETNCNININDEIITVCFENHECKINAKYNKSFEMFSYSKEDNYMFWGWAFCIAFLIGIFAYCTAALILTMLIYMLEWGWKKKIQNH